MKPNTADIRWIEEIYDNPDPRAQPSDACPDLDRLRAAAAAELPLEERREILDHAVGCAYCTESWRLAIQLGARPKMPLGAHFFAIIWRDLRFLFELPGRLRRLVAPRLAAIDGAWLLPGAALALVAVVAVLVPALDQTGRHSAAINRGVEAESVRSLLAEDQALLRDRVVLKWSGPADALYDVRVTTEEGREVDTVRALAATEYQVPEEKLRDLEAGAVLRWSVSVHATDTAPVRFRIRLQ